MPNDFVFSPFLVTAFELGQFCWFFSPTKLLGAIVYPLLDEDQEHKFTFLIGTLKKTKCFRKQHSVCFMFILLLVFTLAQNGICS